MGKTTARLLIATSLIAGAGFGRLALTVSAAPLFAHSPVLTKAASNVSCFDTSPHKASFVTVAPDVRLEVLDWGGTGEPMVLLTGLGDNAHAYDEFAYQFTDRFHVIGITRRGYGRSSQPLQGYDLATRVRDDIAVLDILGIRQVVFVGHSVAGTELSKLAADYPDRVTKLVYLDALDLGSGGWAALPQPPPAPDMEPSDLVSVQRVAAAMARDDGYRKPLAAICNMTRFDSSGKAVGPVTPPEIGGKIIGGLQPVKQAEFDRSGAVLSKWVHGAITRFGSQVKNARVVELHDTNHYVYVVDEASVVREMRTFLLQRTPPAR